MIVRAIACLSVALHAGDGVALAAERPTAASVMQSASEADWRKPDPHFTLYLSLPAGLVIMELAPAFAPNVIENIRTMTEADYFASTAIVRSQENYVVQWGDPAAETENAVPLGEAVDTVDAEFHRSLQGLNLVTIDSRDTYADTVGFVDGFPTGSDGRRAWLAHCNAMLGVGRANASDSGNGTELYVVTGHAPRHLDRNVVLIGRVLKGMELLTTLPRGTGPLGFYESAEEHTPINWMRFADQIAADARVDLEVLKTDTRLFRQFVEARRYRAEEWFVDPAGRISLCNVPIPVREGGGSEDQP